MFDPWVLASPEMAALVPQFSLIVDDLTEQSNAALQARSLAAYPRLVLWLLRDGRDPVRLLDSFDAWRGAMLEVEQSPDGAAVLAELRARVHSVELERASERQRTGRRVLGRRAVLAQSWRDHPATREPRRNLHPAVPSRSKWARIEALLRNRGFAMEYASARERWRDGAAAVFPAGTYWLQRFASVPVFET